MDPDVEARGSTVPHWAVALVLIAATLLAFWPTLAGSFVYDDYDLFIENESYRGLSPKHIAWMFSNKELGHWQPLTWVTWGVDYVLYGMEPRGYHVTSVLLHALNAVLFYALLLGLWARVPGGSVAAASARTRRLAAASGALLFALHPLRVESVAWITERGGMLAATFVMLTTIAWLRAYSGVAERPPLGRYLLAVALYALAVCSKAWAMTLPVTLLVLCAYPLWRVTRASFSRILLLVPFGILGAAAVGIAYYAKSTVGALQYMTDYTFGQRVAQAAYGMCFYVAKFVWPSDLNVLYVLERDLNPGRPLYVASMVAIVAITGVLIVLRRRWPAGLTAWVVCAITASPVLMATQGGYQITADRYTYLVCLPYTVLVASGILVWMHRSPRSVLAAVAVVGGVLGFLSHRQSQTWLNPHTLWARALEVDPTNRYAHHNRGIHLQREAFRKQREGLPWRADVEAAIAAYGEAIRHEPDHYEDHRLSGVARMRVGDFARARIDLDTAVELWPRHAELRHDRAVSYLSGGQVTAEGVAKATADIALALSLDPNFAKAHFTQGNLHLAQGAFAKAVASFERALQGELDEQLRSTARTRLQEARRAMSRDG